MRHLLFSLVIALLPLRGWVGDVMAMQSIGQSLPALANIQPFHNNTNSGHTAAMPSECPGHATTLVDTQWDDSAHHGGFDCSTCTACQICNSVALTPPPLSVAAADLPAPQLVSLTHHFISAERAQGFKPPIS